MKIPLFDDKILFLQLQKKKKEAFIEFYNQYFDKIYRYVYFKVGSVEEAQDLTSAVFLKLWNYVQEGKLSDFGALKPFAYKVARNVIIDHYRKSSTSYENSDGSGQDIHLKRHVRLEEGLLDSAKEYIDPSQDMIQKIQVSIDIEYVKKKIFLLKDEYREVIMLKYIEELSTSEIEKILKKSKGNIRVLTHRALKSLKDLIDNDAERQYDRERNSKKTS